MTTTARREVHGDPSRGTLWLVVTTTSCRKVRRPIRILTDLQQIELLSILMAKTTKLVEVQVYESKTLSLTNCCDERCSNWQLSPGSTSVQMKVGSY